MSQARLRMYVFLLWISFWALNVIILFLSPWIRKDIERLDILPAIFNISVLWVPAVSCLAGFWFPQGEKSKARSIRVSREKTLAALVLTLTYLLLVSALIIYSTFFIEVNTEVADAGNVTLLGQLTESIRIALLISPMALAPISWLTGGTNSTNIQTAPTDQARG